MRKTDVRPTGIARPFSDDEIIVSKTDPRGITYANDVFLRVSEYDESDVIGQPHNLIRHPTCRARSSGCSGRRSATAASCSRTC